MCCFARNKLLVYVVCVVDISLRHLFCLCQWSGKSSPPLHPTLYTKIRIALAHMRFFYYLCGVIDSIVFSMRTTITILPATMEHKSCPRCGAAFICQHENPAKCQCAGVELSPAIRAHLATQYPNQCLCRKCLIELGTSN